MYAIREARDGDRDTIASIFRHYVEEGFAAYESSVPPMLYDLLKEKSVGFPFYVAEAAEGEVVGFSLLHPHRRSEAFRRAAEVTYFILPGHTRKGLGGKMLEMMITDARKIGIDILLANVSSLNEQSLGFHRKHGFKECGRFERIGRKSGREFDVVWLQRFIG